MQENYNPEVLENVAQIVIQSWSQATICPNLLFSSITPAKGQSDITACIMQDFVGGKIYKVDGDPEKHPEGAHYFNYVDGHAFDIARGKFGAYVKYEQGVEVSAEEEKALRTSTDFNRAVRYTYLKHLVQEAMDAKAKVDEGWGIEEKQERVINFFKTVMPALLGAPWEEIDGPFPCLFELIVFIMDCIPENCLNPLRETDAMDIVEHYLEDPLRYNNYELIKGWEEYIVEKNGRTLSDYYEKR